MTLATAAAALLIILLAGILSAARSPAGTPGPVLLWPDGAPGARGDSPEDSPRLTLYLVSGDGPNACIVVCPGGGYGGRAAHEGEPVARWLNTLGLSAAVLDYRMAPYRHPIPLGDAQRALRLVRAKAADWRLDPRRVGILGFSAGGHLAASASTIFDAGDPDASDPVQRFRSRPDAAVLCYPVITFGEFRNNGSMVNLLGENADPDLRESLSLETRVTPQTPPTFLWHTRDDPAVPVENSLLYASALRRCNVPFALHVFPHGPHGTGLAADVPEVRQWPALCAAWLTALRFTGQ
jgi:acetyl esterase/lipase